MTYTERYEEWKKNVKDKTLLKELLSMEDKEETKLNAFYKELEFGTAGMRGKMGVGSNCLNIYNIRKVSEGVALYMKSKGFNKIAVCYDSRIKSRLFAETAACVFASHNIFVHIVDDIAPTPFLSFAIRKLGCNMGVMITASHNPKQYNGYKLFNSYGCQILDDEVDGVCSYVDKVNPFDVKPGTFKKYEKLGIIKNIEAWVYGSYLNSVESQGLNEAGDLKIVYTPLNGCGYKLVPEVLYERGFRNITTVDKQSLPNGKFTTCPYPNPEKPDALKLAIKTAKEVDADIVLGTDPDCDRVGVAVKYNGKYVLINGNEMGVLLADYILGTKYCRWSIPHKAEIVTTIVSTPQIDKLAARFGVNVVRCLTGFRWIGNEINKLEKDQNEDRFVLGFEESYGYLVGTHARDKDAVVTSMLICEMASLYKKQGKTLIDQLKEMDYLYGKYDYKTISRTFEGASGEKIKNDFLEKIRKEPITKIAGGNVIKSTDYLTQTELDIPKSNVLIMDTDNGLRLIIRPSGTEPIVKFYMTGSVDEKTNQKLFEACEKDIDGLLK